MSKLRDAWIACALPTSHNATTAMDTAITEAEETIARLRELQASGCECGTDEVCRHLAAKDAEIARLTRERDEARAEVERLFEERAEYRDRVSTLTRERDEARTALEIIEASNGLYAPELRAIARAALKGDKP